MPVVIGRGEVDVQEVEQELEWVQELEPLEHVCVMCV